MRPLHGRTVLVTRPRRQAAGLARLLRARGARVVLAPVIQTVPPPSWQPLDRALRLLPGYDALVFTSANAVEAFFARAGRRAAPRRLFAVGSATARALAARGWRAAASPESFSGAALARRMGALRGRRVLFPRAETVSPDLPRALRRAGARLDMPVVYRTVPDQKGIAALKREAADGADWVTYTSPSTVGHVFAALGDGAKRLRAAAIGPATSAALRARGQEPAAEARPSTAAGLVASIVARSETAPAPDLRRVLLAALRAAGREMRRGFLKAKVSYKGRANPVTEADHAAEQAILDAISARFPDHDFLTEERAPRESGSDYVWVIDPIDGTVNYAHGFPHSAASVAVVHRGVPVAAGVYDPFRDELFLAERGKGATLNGRRLRVGKAARLDDALLVTGFAYDRHERAALYAGIVRDFLRRAQDLRRSGSAALDLAWVAAGRVDGFWEFHLSPWDVAAGRLLVEEAGGRVSGFDGRPWGPDPRAWGRRTLASNGRIHRAMLAVLGRRRLR